MSRNAYRPAPRIHPRAFSQGSTPEPILTDKPNPVSYWVLAGGKARGDILVTQPKPTFTARKGAGKPTGAELDSRWDADGGSGASRAIKVGQAQPQGFTARKAATRKATLRSQG